MGIFDFFKKNKAIKSLNNSITVDKNILDLYSDILSFNQQIDKLLKEDCFIARSDYKDLIDKYKDSSILDYYLTNLSVEHKENNILSIYATPEWNVFSRYA